MRTICLLLLLLSGNGVFAQNYFEEVPFAEALQQAREKGKMLLVRFDAGAKGYGNEITEKSMSDKQLSEKLQRTFLCLKIGEKHPDRPWLYRRYNITLGCLFFDPSGIVVYKIEGASSSPDFYMKHIEAALVTAGEPLKLNLLETEYTNGNRRPDFLEMLLFKRRELGMVTDSLLEEYTFLLPPDSLRSVRTLRVLYQMAPVLESKASRALNADSLLLKNTAGQFSTTELYCLNAEIIRKSHTHAIRRRNEALALRAGVLATRLRAQPVPATKEALRWSGLFPHGYESARLFYYLGIRDTARGFALATEFYRNYYQHLSPDSVRAGDSLERVRLFTSKTIKADTIWKDNKMRIHRSIAYVSQASNFSSELNQMASRYYYLTNDPVRLSEAAGWAKRGLDFLAHSSAYNRYALLLYKLGRQQEALAQQTLAIADLQKKGESAHLFLEQLEKMKRAEARIE
ncbi:hypothetical protein V9K67_19865 [Paraflavisolibacter sp. H34]|uniref:hypothetical protein n=1 Tax=Huijunlia imazamoxiresistens TaxID=3127457 RepID=UPI0030168D87